MSKCRNLERLADASFIVDRGMSKCRNLERLADASFIVDCGMSKCRNCFLVYPTPFLGVSRVCGRATKKETDFIED